MHIEPVVIQEGAEKIVLFQGLTGQWYIRGYVEEEFGLQPSHEAIINWFFREALSAGERVEPRGGACLTKDEGFQAESPEIQIFGMSTYCGPIQNKKELRLLLGQAFPHKQISLRLT